MCAGDHIVPCFRYRTAVLHGTDGGFHYSLVRSIAVPSMLALSKVGLSFRWEAWVRGGRCSFRCREANKTGSRHRNYSRPYHAVLNDWKTKDE